jgi:hypothetical protein
VRSAQKLCDTAQNQGEGYILDNQGEGYILDNAVATSEVITTHSFAYGLYGHDRIFWCLHTWQSDAVAEFQISAWIHCCEALRVGQA